MAEKIKKVEENQLIPYQASADSLISKAIEKGVSIETMEKLMNMRRELKAEYAKEQFDRAMSNFQSNCPDIKKTKDGGKTESGVVAYKYAPLDNIVRQVKNLLMENGLSYMIKTEMPEGKVKVVCEVKHIAGHSESTSVEMPLTTKTKIMSDPQQVAATLTFAKRYAFCNAFGILTGDEDNDAQGAGGKETSKTQRPTDHKPTIEETIAGIRTSKDKTALLKAMGGITASKNYSPTQKTLLLTAIDERIAELG